MHTLGRWLGLDRTSGLQALRLTFAAWLAFTLAVLLGIENAYWAAMPIWVVAQPTRGLLLERAIYRVLGTLVGAITGFAILALPQPQIQLLLFSTAIALYAGMTHLLRGTSAYGVLMAGITVAVVVLPAMLAPDHSWDLAWARVQCTLIGVVVVTIVLGISTPAIQRDAFYRRARNLAADAVTFVAQTLNNKHDPETELRILKALSDLDIEARPTSAGSLSGYRQLRYLDDLLLASLNLMAAGQAMVSGFRPPPRSAHALSDYLHSVAEKLRGDGPTTLTLPDLPGRLPPRRRARLELALLSLCQAATRLYQGRQGKVLPTSSTTTLIPQRDWRLAMRTSATTGLASLTCAQMAILHPGSATELAALGVCIFSVLLGSMPQPQKHAPKLIWGVFAGILGATVYRLGVQPHISGFIELTLTLLPFILIGGILRASKRFAVPAIDANMCFMLASQAGLPAVSSGEVFSDSMALLLGSAVTALGFIVLPRTTARAERLTRNAIITDLHHLLRSTDTRSREHWLARAGRRILLLMTHIGSTDQKNPAQPDGFLALLNLGQSIIDLQQLRQIPELSAISQQAIYMLESFDDLPQETAAELVKLSGQCRDLWLTVTLQIVAQALQECQEMLSSNSKR